MAVLGASGAVGQELLQLLQERNFPVAELRLLASARSAGQVCSWNGQTITVQEVCESLFQGVDLVLASAGGSVSRQWREAIVSAGAVMVDASNEPPHGLHPLQRHDMHASADGWLPQSGCSQLSNDRSPTTREVHAAPRGREDDVWAAPLPFFLPPPAGEGSAKEEEVVGAAQKRQPWQRQ